MHRKVFVLATVGTFALVLGAIIMVTAFQSTAAGSDGPDPDWVCAQVVNIGSQLRADWASDLSTDASARDAALTDMAAGIKWANAGCDESVDGGYLQNVYTSLLAGVSTTYASDR
ncbi:MAG: hypothetical protein AB7J35_05985 [Dehalococcoidia bacterium]